MKDENDDEDARKNDDNFVLLLVLVLGFENQNFSRMKDENDDEDDSGRTSTMTREGNIRTRHGTVYRV